MSKKRLYGRYFSWDEARDIMRNLGWKATAVQTWGVKNGEPYKIWEVYKSTRKNYPPKVKHIDLTK